LPAQLAFSANGKISGTVRDASTKQAVPGANVQLVGTTQGGSADAEGRYYILNVAPGRYSVQASAVGFKKTVIENVVVTLDQTLELNFDLQSEAVEVSEVVVSAERRVVDKNRTSTKTTVTSDEITALPTVSALELLNTTPAAFRGFVRGGKITETRTVVDGVDVTDQLYPVAAEQTNQGILQNLGMTRNRESQLSTAASVTMGSVEQFALNTGAAGAGDVTGTAGLVTYSLKEGTGPLTGSISARVSQFNGLHYAGPNLYWNDQIYFDDEALTKHRLDSLRSIPLTSAVQTSITRDSIRYSKYSYSRGKYINQDSPLMDFEGSLGGNLTDDMKFYFTGKYYDSHGRLPNERNREADGTLKLSYNLSSAVKLSAFGILNDRGQLFGWKNTKYFDQLRFFLEGVPKNNGLDYVASLKATHVLSPSTFYEVQLSQTYNENTFGFTDGNGDGYCALNEGGDFIKMDTQDQINKYISQASTDLGKFFRIGDEASASQLPTPLAAGNTQVNITRPQFLYDNEKSTVNTLRADLTSQLNYNHQFKAGFQLRLEKYSKIDRNSTLGADATDARRRLLYEAWTFYPSEAGVYASDRMEYGGLVINLGLRLDRFDPNVHDFANYFNLFQPDTINIDGQWVREIVPIRSASRLDPTWFVSPRIGVSHPISDEAAMFFSFSRTAVPPPFSRLYSSYGAVFGAGGSLPQFNSLRQDLTKSSNYELGLQWEFIPGKFGLNFTAYMRDVQNYSPVQLSLFLANGNDAMWINGQYADARGVEMSLQALRQSYFDDILTITGRLSYAYTYIKASGWTGNDGSQRTSFTAADSLAYNNLLPFQDFRYYNTVENNIVGGQSNLLSGYDRTHRLTYTLTLGFPYDIMLSSIGTFQSGFFYPLTFTADPRVSGRALGQSPWNKLVDFRLEKGFTFNKIRAAIYAEVKNAFNWVNIIGYDNTTTGASLWETTNATGNPDPTGTLKRAVGTDGSLFYDIPREYYFGVRIDL
jgi:hypothetical protein